MSGKVADLSNWGKVHCAECEAVIGYFQPGEMEDESLEDIVLYCFHCTTFLDREEH